MMKYFMFMRVNDGLAVFITFIALIALFGIIYGIYLLIKKTKKAYLEDISNFIEGVATKREIIAEINTYINRANTVSFSTILIDIDNSDELVENFGKEEINQMYYGLARKLLDVLPERISLGRIGEDKFLVFVRGVYTREDTVKLAKILLKTISEPISIYGVSALQITASLGVAFYPVHGRNANELIDSLTIATYVSKKNGGNQYKIYSKDTASKESENLQYYLQIKEGIKNKQFDLYFQPMIDAKTDEMFAFEGLIRWNHPEHGLLAPIKFMSIMEQSGDIYWVGKWGLETLIKEQFELKRITGVDYIASLNLSPKQLMNPKLATDFIDIIKKHKIQPSLISLEIEEFNIFENQEQVRKNIEVLKEKGFRIAIKGFGLDYKALDALEKNPVSMIKVEKDSLDLDHNNFLKERFTSLLVDFCNRNDCMLVCETIENKAIFDKVTSLGIEKFQGFYFGVPMSRENLNKYIQNQDWRNPHDVVIEEKNTLLDDEPSIIESIESLEEQVEEKKIEETPLEEIEEGQEESLEESPLVEVADETLILSDDIAEAADETVILSDDIGKVEGEELIVNKITEETPSLEEEDISELEENGTDSITEDENTEEIEENSEKN